MKRIHALPLLLFLSFFLMSKQISAAERELALPDSTLLTTAIDPLICIGQAGTISVQNTQVGVSYQLFNGTTSIDLPQAGTGGMLSFITSILSDTTIFVVRATNADGFVTLPEVTINTVPEMLVTTTTTNVTSIGNDGTVDICVNGGIAPYSISAISPQAGLVKKVTGICDANYRITGLKNGSYNFTITDSEGCGKTTTVKINNSTCTGFRIYNATAKQQVSCKGGSNGVIEVMFDGESLDNVDYLIIDAGNNQAPVKFTKEELGVGSAFLTNLPAGTYYIVVTDNQGCQAQYIQNPIQLAEPSEYVDINSSVTNTSVGNNGAIFVCVNGGTPNYTFNIVPNAGTVTDGNSTNCTSSYQINNLAAGNYYLRTIDAAGCRDSVFVVVNSPSCSIKIDSIKIDTMLCSVSKADIQIFTSRGTAPFQMSRDGGLTFSPMQTSPIFTIQNATVGSHQFIIRDANGCIVKNSQHIRLLPNPLVLSSYLTHIATVGGNSGRAEICVVGGAAPYTATITPNVGVSNTSSGGCSANFIFSNLSAGTYTVNVTDKNACSNAITFVIYQATCNDFVVNNVLPDTIMCFNSESGTLQINAQGGVAPFTVLLNGYEPFQVTQMPYTVQGLDTGFYYVRVRDSRGCEFPYQNGVTVVENPSMNTEFEFIPPCVGQANGILCLNPDGGVPGYSYLVEDTDGNPYTVNRGAGKCGGEFHVTGLKQGSYFVEMKDTLKCVAQGLTTITEEGFEVSASVQKPCRGANVGSIALSVSGGYQPFKYKWSNNATTKDLSNLAAGTYTVTVEDNRGCTATQSVLLEESNLSVSLTPTTTCVGQNNGTVTLSVSNGQNPYTFKWSNNASTQNLINLATGSYTVTTTDARGCFSVETTNIGTYSPTLTLTPAGTCQGQNNGTVTTTVSNAVAPVRYAWSNGASSANIGPVAPATYSVTVTDILNCKLTATTTVEQFPAVVATVSPPVTIVQGTSTNLSSNATGGTSPFTYTWSPTSGLNNNQTQNPSAAPNSTTTYAVTVRDSKNCSDTKTVTVTVVPKIIVVMPTGFTPNEDGDNDTFEPYTPNFDVQFTNFQIFDRWGKLVFENKDASPWDGKYNGTLQPMGAYVYVVQYLNELNESQTIKGQVTLIR